MMKTSKTFYLGMALAAFALGTFVAIYPASADSQRERLKTDLEGGGAVASGNAKWEKRGEGTCATTADRCKFSVEVEDFAANEMVTIESTCTGFPDTKVMVDGNGFFDLNLDTDLENAVPDCVTNDTVTATGATSGDTITGTLRPD